MANTTAPGIGTQNTRPTRAQRRNEAAKVTADDNLRPVEQPAQQARPELEPSQSSRAVSADLATSTPPAPIAGLAAATSEQKPASQPTPAATPQVSGVLTKLEAKKTRPKVHLSTYILADTDKRLAWFRKQHEYSVTDVVDVALQELFDRSGVPAIDPTTGNIHPPK